ncbi:MAG: putative Rossmann fold nucleotide-binding protein [Marmoricola sp.]|nr:putative Rossmann fold nucleotide-binding protein [Marmoricola sp.]
MQEIETLTELDEIVARHAASLRGWHLQSLDLTDRVDALAAVEVAGAVFLGCRFAPGSEDDVRRRGGLVFPTVPAVPFDPYRATLYSPDDLYAGLAGGYEGTPDALAYAWSLGERSLDRTLAAALHDHAIDDALEEYVEGRSLVGVMGGHAVPRDSAEYATAARLGRALGGVFTVATGGGPGAMEAANLGAWLTGAPADALTESLGLLSAVPDFTGDVGAWARAALDVRKRWPHGSGSLGIPTWYYGQEPPNALASVIAKYFNNAVREDMLLKVCRGGLVFLPGAAGTVQEIFQSACTNYYADSSGVTPMVLVGREHWTRTIPVEDLLRTLGNGRPFGARLYLVDSTEEVLPLLVQDRGDRR